MSWAVGLRKGVRVTRQIVLNGLSLEDLERLGAVSCVMPRAIDLLAECAGLSPCVVASFRVSIAPDFSVTITSGPLFHPEMFEVVEAVEQEDIGPQEEVLSAPQRPVGTDKHMGGGMPDKPAPAESPALVTGPMTAAEKARVWELRAEGREAAEIAVVLGRRANIITMMIRNRENGRGLQAEHPAAASAPTEEGAAADVSEPPPDVAADDAPVVNGAETASAPAATAIKVTVRSQQDSAVSYDDTVPQNLHGDGIPDGIKGDNLLIWRHLDGVGYAGGFDAEMDYDLVSGLGAGQKLAQIALDLDMDAGSLKARFRALASCVTDIGGRVTIEGQQRLTAMLKERALRARGARCAV